ncbi:ATP-dependent DNA helicase RecG [Geopsychrobacter electrodiphilus]|uniref:ATP-dependent DNA helicase RecG n=1 Tax=Geopsychrobacter electrodiphilus TaxID=225196 RepID=UPI000381E928|nr:ATP-dependent DNA helicase RecG [Geopsychrobacter electrodiphilus]
MPPNSPVFVPLDQIGLDRTTGVGPKLLAQLNKLGLNTIEDALYHLPSRYEDRRHLRKINQLQTGRQEVFCARVLAAGEALTSRSRRLLFEVIAEDETGRISLKWFHYRKSWLQKRFSIGQQFVFIGEIHSFGAQREIHHPDTEIIPQGVDPLELLSKDPLKFGRILPVYPLTEGLSQYKIRKIWFDLVKKYAPLVRSPLPIALAQKHGFLPLSEAIFRCHWPESDQSLSQLESGQDPARRSVVYDEFFFLELGLALKRHGIEIEQGIAFKVDHLYTKPLSALLPFRLTVAQRRVLGEIKRDMMSNVPMHRLLQGDVGSGKTIVALMAALIAIENETQVAVLAPTEILAEQHFSTFSQWLPHLGLRCELLRSGIPQSERKRILADLESGDLHLLVGTHAVLQEGVQFKRLGLGIVDEQHRFGVKQRGVLKQKGENPDILVMTATPIPRTLSMTLYGDLALSVIDELPPGRIPVKTHHYPEGRRNLAYEGLRRQLALGRQAYIVYPLVEETENSDLLAATEASVQLAAHFPDARIGLLHGRMKQADKDLVMQEFRSHQLDILVATTVIEVGVDVANATIMIIEHADRFGLAQLHQLRGRVGRGGDESFCFLLSSGHYSEEARQRLDVMVETSDGFRIAEADLEIRGPGEFLGTRQSGLPDFRVASILRDGDILEMARQDAFEFAQTTNYLADAATNEVKQELLRRWGGRLDLITIG